MRIKQSASCVTNIGRLLFLMSSRVPMLEWSDYDRVAFHCGQYDLLLEAYDPVYLRILRLQFADTCVKARPVYDYGDDGDKPVDVIYDDGVMEVCDSESTYAAFAPPPESTPLVGMVIDPFVTLDDVVKWKVHDSDSMDRYAELFAREEKYRALAMEWFKKKEKIVTEGVLEKKKYVLY